MFERIKNLGILSMISIFLLTIFSSIVLAQEVNWTMDQNMTQWLQYIPWVAPMIGVGILVICLIIFVIPLILAILVGIWMYKDAEKRGKEGILWLILLILATIFLTWIGFIIVLIIWLAVRPPIKGKSK